MQRNLLGESRLEPILVADLIPFDISFCYGKITRDIFINNVLFLVIEISVGEYNSCCKSPLVVNFFVNILLVPCSISCIKKSINSLRSFPPHIKIKPMLIEYVECFQ